MKLGSWMIMIVSMILFLSFMGINIPGLNPIPQAFGITIDETNSTLINADIENSGFFRTLFSEEAVTVAGIEFSKGILIALVGTAVIIIGLFAKGYDTSLVILPLVVLIAGIFAATFWGIIQYVNNFNQGWITAIVTIIFGGLSVGFIMALVDYYAGR